MVRIGVADKQLRETPKGTDSAGQRTGPRVRTNNTELCCYSQLSNIRAIPPESKWFLALVDTISCLCRSVSKTVLQRKYTHNFMTTRPSNSHRYLHCCRMVKSATSVCAFSGSHSRAVARHHVPACLENTACLPARIDQATHVSRR